MIKSTIWEFFSPNDKYENKPINKIAKNNIK